MPAKKKSSAKKTSSSVGGKTHKSSRADNSKTSKISENSQRGKEFTKEGVRVFGNFWTFEEIAELYGVKLSEELKQRIFEEKLSAEDLRQKTSEIFLEEQKSKGKTPPKLSLSKELLIVDNAPIRKKNLKAFDKAIADLEKLQVDLTLFQSKAVPEYDTWYNNFFKEKLQKISELRLKEAELSDFIAEVQYYRDKYRVTYREAVEVLERWKKDPIGYKEFWETVQKKEEEIFQKKWEEFFKRQQGFTFGDSKEDFEDEDSRSHSKSRNGSRTGSGFRSGFGGEAFQDFGEGDDDDWDEDDFGNGSRSQRFSQNRYQKGTGRNALENESFVSKEDQLKLVYRKLVRKLHPDHRKQTSKELEEMWHEVQDAYQQGNLTRLESLDGLSDMLLTSEKSKLSIWQILSITKIYKQKLKALKGHINLAKKQPAWKFFFGTQSERARFQNELSFDMDRQLLVAKSNTKKLEKLLEVWRTGLGG